MPADPVALLLGHPFRDETFRIKGPMLQSWFGGSGDLNPTQNEPVTNP
jgi:hypothetical protein